MTAASGVKAKKASGGSAINRLRETIKSVGGHQSLGKKKNKKNSSGKAAEAAAAHREVRMKLRQVAEKAAKENPFEMQFSRHQKHDVLNRRVKGVTGKPLEKRKKSEETRSKTLAKELGSKNRVSAFVDRRFGENDPTMSLEDKMMERFMREKHGRSDRGADFNLEEEDLTHMGRSLSGMESFDDPTSFEDEEYDAGQIDKNTVRRSHFGGFGDEGPEPVDETTGRKKSRGEIMAEVIAKSKFHKAERQKDSEEVAQLVDEVDAGLDDIRSLLFKDGTLVSQRQTSSSAAPSAPESNRKSLPSQLDEYDRFVKELQHEARGVPQNRLKTEEELALEEKEKLEKLERERLKRMVGDVSEDPEPTGKSSRRKSKNDDSKDSKKRRLVPQADDLDEDYLNSDGIVGGPRDETRALEYKDGVLVNDEIFMKPAKKKAKQEAKQDLRVEDEDEFVEEEAVPSDDDEDDGEDEEDEEDDGEEEDDDGDENEEVEEGEGDDDVDDVFDDAELLEGEEESLDEDENEDEEDDRKRKGERIVGNKAQKTSPSTTTDDASSTIPYTFPAPKSCDELTEILANRTPDEQAIILQRIRVLYHVKLGGDNRTKLEVLLAILIEYTDDLLDEFPPNIPTFLKIFKHIFELSVQFPEVAADIFKEKLRKIRERIVTKEKFKANSCLSVRDVYTFRMIGSIFSISDLDHPVGSLAIMIMSEYLANCRKDGSIQSIAGVFLCEVIRDYERLSRRYYPEALDFLQRLLKTLVKLQTTETTFAAASAKSRAKDARLPKPQTVSLRIISKYRGAEEEDYLLSELHRSSLLAAAIESVTHFASLYSETAAFIEIFSPFVKIIDDAGKLWSESDDEDIKVVATAKKTLKELIAKSNEKRRPLQLQKRKPMAIATYAPKFQENYSLDRRYDPDRDRAKAKKLKAEYKREFKGATRELRKDGKFIARKRLEEKIASAEAYKKRMTSIMGSLAEQEGAMRKMEKMAGKAKAKKK